MSTKKVALLILDGWGIGKKDKTDAIANARTPFVTSALQQYPHATLKTSGLDVGLPTGQMGNSEVGHLNIGAGRVVYQDLAKINKEVEEGNLNNNSVLLNAIDYTKSKGCSFHLMGLVSDGGVHSSLEHLVALCAILKDHNVKNVYIHCFTDGRDTDPKSSMKYVGDLIARVESENIQVASIVGRYYAMDRDKRWERVKITYDLLVKGKGEKYDNLLDGISDSYQKSVTDEFIKPLIKKELYATNKPLIKNEDVVLCFNFRTDRCREITQVLTQHDEPAFEMSKLNLHYLTMTNYDESFKNVNVMYDKDNLYNTLGEVLAKHNKTQLRIAETEKYPHVTFFFSGGREVPFKDEIRIMAPSPKVATYDLQPEMNAQQVADEAINDIEKHTPDFICLNFANADMVGHTGVYDAVVKAVEKVDECAGKVVAKALEKDYSIIIIADHGNADYMINVDGTPNTAHTTNLVPCILIDKEHTAIKDGRLADIAPTVLKLMGIEQPAEMDGQALV